MRSMRLFAKPLKCRLQIQLKCHTRNISNSTKRFRKVTDYDGNEDRSEPRVRISSFGDYHKLLNYDLVHVNEERVEATLRHPGFAYSDYDINAQPKVWMLLKILESSRFYAHHYQLDDTGRTFRDYAKLTSDRLIFLVASEIRMTKELYDHSIPKFPLNIKIVGGAIGNTSLNSVTTIYSDVENIELVQNINRVVSIDKNTRRPLPLPDWWKEKYTKTTKAHDALKMTKFEIPTGNTGFYQHKVAWSETDLNEHTNWGAYFKYCVNAAHHCAKKGSLKHFHKNVTNGVRLVHCYFYGESLEDDLLDIYCWEDPHDTKKLYFDIHRGQNSINQCVFHFF